jgi:phosphoribosylformimino-5-aminoimidazole carboxamide ribotide isomerase
VLIIPAIDLRGGQCVRLLQGDYAKETIFGSDPAHFARHWVDLGATYLHVVDLDGAKLGRPANGESIRAIVKSAGVPCELGGGLRADADIAEALSWGVDRVVIGTGALKDLTWFEQLSRRYAGQVALGIDARNGRVATHGWLQESDQSAVDLARRCEAWPLAAIVYTDISRDGMLTGPNFEAIAELKTAVRLPVIASGGVSRLDDISGLARLGVDGCIIGRALYEGQLNLREAIQLVSGE